MEDIISIGRKEKRFFLPLIFPFAIFFSMKRSAAFLILLGLILSVSGCYTPEGGSSLPWNQPTQDEGSTSFTPRVTI